MATEGAVGLPWTAARVVSDDCRYVLADLGAALQRLNGKRILITGGAGFLGYYLVQVLLYRNADLDPRQRTQVVVLDNFARGMPAWLEAWRDEPSLTAVAHDVVRPLPVDIGDFHYVVHAASIASPTYYRRHPIETMEANVDGLRQLLVRCREQQLRGSPVEAFLFFSTSEIYGDPLPEHIPTPETYRGNVSCTGPRACYDEAKRYGETLCVNYARQYLLPVKIARPFNNYGPGLKITDRRALPDFARDVLAGRDVRILSDGRPTRTFCYVADAVAGYYRVLLKGRPGEPYNIGVDAPEISVAQLAQQVVELARELFDYRGRVILETSEDPHYLTDNPNRRCPSIEKARGELGYRPRITLQDGLRRSLIWYAEHRDAHEG